MAKIVGLTFDLKTDYLFKDSDPHDANAEFDSQKTIDLLYNAISECGYEVKKIGNVFSLLEKIDNLGVDIVFNICEGSGGRNRESQVPVLLEMKGIPFVGADGLSLSLALDKLMTKKVLISEGIPTPRFMLVDDADSLLNTDSLNYPLIVKPRHEGSSKGIDSNAKVNNFDELKKRAGYVINIYNQSVLVEEFIKGKEFTVAVVGNNPPEVLPPVQIKIKGQLDLGYKFYDVAYLTSNELEYVCPAQIDKELEGKLKELALRTYHAIDCRDFGRIDFRVDGNNNLYVLEINPLPCLAAEDVFMLISEVINSSYPKMIGRILESAFQRYEL